jgi:Tol biopolymer transport system component
VDAGGGTPAPFTTLTAGQTAHRWPQFLPDGRVLFFARSADATTQGIYVTSVDSPADARLLRTASSSGAYSSGHLLFVLGDDLMAQPLDPKTLQPAGEAVSLGLKVSVSTVMSSALSVSRDGVLATWSGNGVLGELVWFDAHGSRLGTVGRPDRYVDFRLSPDDRRLAVSRVDPVSNTPDLAVVDLGTGGLTTLTSSPGTDATPVWSADGMRIVFRSNRQKLHDLFERPAHGGGRDRLLYSSGHGMYPTDWSADEGLILFHLLNEATEHDIWGVDARGARQVVLQTAAAEMQGQLAPGGRLAYTSNQSGTLDVYVRPRHGDGGPVNVSVTGGFDPRWRADGRELFFISAGGALMASALASEDPLRFAPARTLFQTGIHGTDPPYLSNFVVTRDAQRFLLHVPLQEPGAEPITITEHWPGRLAFEER